MGTAAIFGEACIVALISAGVSCLFRRYSRNQFEGYHASNDCAGLQCPCLSRSLYTLASLGCVSQDGQCRPPFASDTVFLNSVYRSSSSLMMTPFLGRLDYSRPFIGRKRLKRCPEQLSAPPRCTGREHYEPVILTKPTAIEKPSNKTKRASKNERATLRGRRRA